MSELFREVLTMHIISVVRSLLLVLTVTLFAGCGASSSLNSSSSLSSDNINLIFVSSPDLKYQAAGDVDPDTANLTSQGLRRSLLMASYLKQQVLGAKNVTAIYTLAPMTHLQNGNKFTDVPDMTAIGYIQQFALLNQYTMLLDKFSSTYYTANSYPIEAAYANGAVPDGVAVPTAYCPDCSGLDFKNSGGNNDVLVSGIINRKKPGYYVFSAPWETVSALLAAINSQKGYNLAIPVENKDLNQVYALSIPPSGSASLVTYNSNLNPASTYPWLSSPASGTACTYLKQGSVNISRIGGVGGAVVPATINKNQTVYIVRHAEAHPDPNFIFENGNFVAAGQWRALDLPSALLGKIRPDMVYSIDPSQWFRGSFNFSYVRPSLTVFPYAIANRLPYYLVSEFQIFDANAAKRTSDYFFTDPKFSNKTLLLGWESQRINPMIKALIDSYGVSGPVIPWPGDDYDTVWTVKTDDQGNLTVSNELCEGIDTTKLPETAPPF